MNPKDMKLWKQYMCKDFGVVTYEQERYDWYLMRTEEYGVVGYNIKDVTDSLRELNKLERYLLTDSDDG